MNPPLWIDHCCQLITFPLPMDPYGSQHLFKMNSTKVVHVAGKCYVIHALFKNNKTESPLVYVNPASALFYAKDSHTHYFTI